MMAATPTRIPMDLPEATNAARPARLLPYFALGIVFGVVLMKSEVVSWYRIQEMFRFQAFHMYGVLGSAVAVATVSVAILRRRGARSLTGEPIGLQQKDLGRGYRYWLGGTIFGLGWALTGACPGPLAALLGAGLGVFAVAIASALLGTWVYGRWRSSLPH